MFLGSVISSQSSMNQSQKTTRRDRNHKSDVTTVRLSNHNIDNSSIHDNTSICLSDEDSDGEGLDEIIRELDPKHRGVTPPNGEGSDDRSQCSSITCTIDYHQHTIAKNSKEGSRPSLSTKDSLLSPCTRALQHNQIPYPRRSDFGDYYPDGGWGWVVCGAMFVVHFLAHGLHLAAGTLAMEMLSELNISKLFAVWICSVSYGLSSMLSPVIVTICRHKSPRLLALVGGLLTSLACLFMSFADRGYQLFAAMGLVLPLGTGLSLSTAGIMLGRYFRKRRECSEMLALCGGGVGMAVVSVFQAQLFSTLRWMHTMQAVAALMVPILLAGTVYRSPTIYHPRRKVILLLKSLTKTKKQRQAFENKPPYLDFSPLKMRSIQVLLCSTVFINAGTYVPFLLLPGEASSDAIPEPSYNLIMVFLGVAFAFGSLVFGLIVVRTNVRCMISRQYLVQFAAMGCGVATLMFSLPHYFHGYALYVWAYGLCCGGYVYTLRMYTHELVTDKLSERTAGYVTFAQGLPVIFAAPLARWLNDSVGGPGDRYGFIFAGVCMLLGAIILLLMPWAIKHKSNREVIQAAHISTEISDEAMLFDMHVSDDTSSKISKHNGVPAKYDQLNGKCIDGQDGTAGPVTCKPGVLSHSDDEPWSHIESMSPISSTDKVTEFLMHSQNMLHNYSRIHHMGLSDVKLEISNQYPSKIDLADGKDEIKDLTLQATVCRNSANNTSVKSRPSPTECAIVPARPTRTGGCPSDVVLSDTEVCQTIGSFHGEMALSQATFSNEHCNRPGEITTTV